MKKLLSLLISLVLFLGTLAPGLVALAEETSLTKENPYYLGSSITQFADTAKPAYYIYKNQKYYPEGETFYKIIRDKLAVRTKKFSINLYSEGKLSVFALSNCVTRFFQHATDDDISQSSTDGDYARWSVDKMSIDDYDYNSDSNGYYYNLVLSYSYYTTDQEEKLATQKINEIVKTIRQMNISDYELIKYLHDYICSIATYDYNSLKNPSNYKYAFTAYGILCKGLGVCQGYASAFYRICKELGYNVRFVSSDPNKGCHAWNLIELDNKYYYIDLTWDDEIIDSNENLSPYYYFLVNYDTLRSKDSRSYEHTLYRQLYDNDYFNEQYRNNISSDNFDLENANGFSTCTVSLSNSSFTYNATNQVPNIEITDNEGKSVTSFIAQFTPSVIDCGKVRITIKGTGDYDGYTTYRSYVITPKKMTSLSLVSSGRTNKSINVKWAMASGKISGYELQIYKGGSWKTLKNLASTVTSFNATSLSPSTTYKFRIRSYVDIDGHIYYGAYSSTFTTPTRPNAPSISSLATKSKALTVNWKKITCSGYELQYSKNSSMSGAKTVNLSSSAISKKISKLTKGKRYYVRIRAYKTYDGKKYYSSWSSKKYITIK